MLCRSKRRASPQHRVSPLTIQNFFTLGYNTKGNSLFGVAKVGASINPFFRLSHAFIASLIQVQRGLFSTSCRGPAFSAYPAMNSLQKIVSPKKVRKDFVSTGIGRLTIPFTPSLATDLPPALSQIPRFARLCFTWDVEGLSFKPHAWQLVRNCCINASSSCSVSLTIKISSTYWTVLPVSNSPSFSSIFLTAAGNIGGASQCPIGRTCWQYCIPGIEQLFCIETPGLKVNSKSRLPRRVLRTTSRQGLPPPTIRDKQPLLVPPAWQFSVTPDTQELISMFQQDF